MSTAPRGPVVRMVPDGDNRERDVCTDCGFINYRNPRIVVGAVVEHDNRILLCRRAIPPRTGYWTMPAGYLETGETAAAGARREAEEEAGARIAIDRTLGIYSLPRISLIQLIFAARLVHPEIAPGPESLEVGLFTWDKVPWDHLAFPSVRWALEDWRRDTTTAADAASFGPFDQEDLADHP